MTEMNSGCLICEGITKQYKEKQVLKGIDVTLERGKIYGLIGRNGAGKTTLLSILSAQNPATAGNVTVDGEQVWENENALSKICFSREFGGITQSNIMGMSVKNYLKTASIYYPNWDQEMADRLVKEFELDIKQKLMKLSKGMLSMVTIIVALASKAEFTFLDEPVAGLDVFMRDKFYQILLEEYTETGRTFVVSTHIIDEASPIFEEVLVIKNGALILKENTEKLLGRSVHVSGKDEDVDKATKTVKQLHVRNIGRRKEVTVLLEEGQSIDTSVDVTVSKVSLQNVFIALCGDDKLVADVAKADI